MSDSSSSTSSSGELSDSHTAPEPKDVIIPIDPDASTDVNQTSDATGEALPRKVSKNVFSPRMKRRRERRPFRPPLVQRIEDYPRGYPRLTAFMDSNDFFKIYRKFDFLRGRLLLDRQIELAELEEKLITIDKEDSAKCLTSTMSREGTEGRTTQSARRFKALMDEIHKKLNIYDDLVLRAKTFIALKPPHPADHDSFRNEVINQMPLTIDENAYLERNDDFMSLADEQEIGWLDVAVGRMLGLLPSNLLMTKEQRERTDAPEICLRSSHRVDVIVRAVLCATTVLLLVGPSAILLFLANHSILKMVLISVFTALFAVLLSISTKGKRHEISVATATYCAVLVVFLCNIAPNRASSG